MKFVFVLALFLFSISFYGQTIMEEGNQDLIDLNPKNIPQLYDSTIYSGTFNGKSLLFSNQNLCLQKIIINGKKISNNLNSITFAIEFTKLNIRQGDKVSVKIIYNKGCLIECLNREALNK